jgi:Domain of unknown function (DUF1844)
MSQTEKPFTVSDRRHFTPEGRPRDDEEGVPAAEAPRAGAPPLAETGTLADAPTAASPSPTPEGPADFSQFLLGLAAQAGMLLSGEGLPEGADPREALAAARSVIAILEMLKSKTEGRLTGPEETLLDELLFQLRMVYVEKTRAGGA